MNKFLTDRLASRAEDQDGFSFLEMVIAGVLLGALAASGVVGYGKVVENAKMSAVKGAASSVYDAAAVYAYDDDPMTSECSAIDEYNESSKGVDVELIVPNPAAPDDRAQDRYYYGDFHSTKSKDDGDYYC